MSNINKPLLYLAFAALFTLTLSAFFKEGLLGMITPFKASLWTWQYFIDLVIALVLVLYWIVEDCRKRGKQYLPWVVATLFTGSFAPLLYLILRKHSTVSNDTVNNSHE